VYQSSVQYAYPAFPYTYHKALNIINVLAGVKIGFGFKQQTLYTKKYYTKMLHNRIARYNKIVLKNYIEKNITRTKLREYYAIRNEQFDNIKKTYLLNPKDT